MANNPTLVKVDGRELTINDVVVHLKVTGAFKQAFEEVVENAVIVNHAKELNQMLSDDELQEAANQARYDLGLHSVKETNAYFERLGITTDQWIDHLEIEETRKKLMKHLFSDEKVEEFFDENRMRYKSIHVSRILVDDQDMAEEIYEQLTEDEEDFGELARKFSVDTDTKLAGGYLGKITPGMLPPAIESRLFVEEAGTVLNPMEEHDKYSIYKVIGVDDGELTDDLKKTIREGLFAGWLNGAMRQTEIEAP